MIAMTNQMINTFLLLISILLLAGCGAGELAPQELVQWVNSPSNGLIKTNQADPFQLSVQYRPIDFIISLEQGGNPVSPSSYDKGLLELEGLEYFALKVFSKSGEEVLRTAIKNEQEYYDRMNYFLSTFQPIVEFIVKVSVLPCRNIAHLAPCSFQLLYFVKPLLSPLARQLIRLLNDGLIFFDP